MALQWRKGGGLYDVTVPWSRAHAIGVLRACAARPLGWEWLRCEDGAAEPEDYTQHNRTQRCAAARRCVR